MFAPDMLRRMERQSIVLWIPGYKKISVDDGLVKSLVCCGDNRKVTFSCVCSSSVIKCLWYHEGKLIEAQQDKLLLRISKGKDFYESALIVSNPKLEDCGGYMCIMNSENTTDVVDFNLHIKGAETAPAPIIYDAGKSSMDETSGAFTMDFSVHCLEVPESVVWERRDHSGAKILLGRLNGRECIISTGRYVFTVRKGSDNIYVLKMEIKGAGLSDEGRYSCKVTNRYGEVTQNFKVKISEGIKPPVFLGEPTVDRMFHTEEDFIITVVVKVASPDRPTVKWINPNNGVVSNSSSYLQSIFTYEEGGSYLAELVLMVSTMASSLLLAEADNQSQLVEPLRL
ncbi:hypothetical protein Y032_0015g2799 [Ancylostoma ceylanicum]|nr:hypothetical protein Y032_0015g2799 [Ancylostoma ceylanicum]